MIRALFLLAAALGSQGTAALSVDPPARPSRPRAAFRLTEAAGHGARFVLNRGQWPAAARARACSGAATAWFVDDGWWLVLGRPQGPNAPPAAVALRMTFEGARASPPRGLERARGVHHYFRGSDPSRWRAHVPLFARLEWRELHPGVALVARAGAGLFEYDLELGPEVDLSAVRVRCDGAEGLRILPDGSLAVDTALGPLVQTPPRAFAAPVGEGETTEVACRFVLRGERAFGFEACGRDPSRPLRIDPGLIWATYLSGSFEQSIEGIAAAPQDTVVCAGTTYSYDFPTTPGAFDPTYNGFTDAFVTRLSADASQLLYSTYLGGVDAEELRSLAVDALGAATVAGSTRSGDFPTTAGAYDTTHNGLSDAFVARLSPAGDQLLWSTYLGGPADDGARALALDAGGATAVAGATLGGFPVTPGAFDATFNGGWLFGDVFVARLSSDGKSLFWATYVGSTGEDYAAALALDAQGGVLFGGRASDGWFPTTSGAYDTVFDGPTDGFVAQLDASGAQLVFSTFLGGTGIDLVQAVAWDAQGGALAGGRTEASDFPTTAGALDSTFAGLGEGFVSRLTGNGATLAGSTFVGGVEDDEVVALAAEASGRVIALANTASHDVPGTPGAWDSTWNGDPTNPKADAYLLRAPPDLSARQYASFFGAPGLDLARALALDAAGNALFGGVTRSYNLPTTPGVTQPTFNLLASNEGFAARLSFKLHPISYGTGKLNSYGAEARIGWGGFPALSESNLELRVESAFPHQTAVLFHGPAASSAPFLGGTLWVKGPWQRHAPTQSDMFGFAQVPVPIDPAWVGTTLYFQWWFADPGDPLGVGLTDGLQILFYP